MSKASAAAKLAECVETWARLNETIMELTEEDCLTLLKQEMEGQRRVQVMLRLYGRFNKLRCERERTGILAGNIKL
mgnify:CR=1 FL=1